MVNETVLNGGHNLSGHGGHLRGFIVWGPSDVANCVWSVVGVHRSGFWFLVSGFWFLVWS